MLEKRDPSSILFTLILDPIYQMLLFFSSLSYTTKISTIAGEILPPFSSLSHDVNVIVLNIQPRTWMRLT